MGDTWYMMNPSRCLMTLQFLDALVGGCVQIPAHQLQYLRVVGSSVAWCELNCLQLSVTK